jgi:peptidoglycan/LPS O-acetylase OafA/YrhL
MNRPGRLYSLDLLRGVAALVVVFWHWSHFYFNGTELQQLTRADLPLFDVFFFFYTKGALAIQLFFSLSGFVFFWLYSRVVSTREISANDFAVLRFSRLYPLHFVTLIVVAALQLGFLLKTGSYFVYPFNDLRHFMLNLAFAPSWGLERGFSFNAPVWSVSVEIVLYALFFAYCRLLPTRLLILFAIAVAGFFATKLYRPIGVGIGFFFLGGCAFVIHERLRQSAHARSTSRMLLVLTLLAWVGTVVATQVQLGLGQAFGAAPAFAWIAGRIGESALAFWPAFLFPFTILAFALWETLREKKGIPFSFLGDISYSTYLIHFPLQLAVVSVVTLLGIPRSIFHSPWALVGFFAVLIPVSLASYHFLEVPAQRYFRRKGLGKDSMSSAHGTASPPTEAQKAGAATRSN